MLSGMVAGSSGKASAVDRNYPRYLLLHRSAYLVQGLLAEQEERVPEESLLSKPQTDSSSPSIFFH